MLLTHRQRHRLHAAFGGRFIAVCYGTGVDSTAMLVALKQAGLRPNIITFADLSAESRPRGSISIAWTVFSPSGHGPPSSGAGKKRFPAQAIPTSTATALPTDAAVTGLRPQIVLDQMETEAAGSCYQGPRRSGAAFGSSS